MEISYKDGNNINYASVNSDGHFDITQHSHQNSMNVHSHKDYGTMSTALTMLVDLSDSTYNLNNGTNYVHVEDLYIGVDSDVNGDYEVAIGFLKDVGPTQGSFVHLYSVTGTKKAGNSKEVSWQPFPNGAKMKSTYVLTDDIITSGDYSTASTITSVKGDSIVPANGDVVSLVTVNAGNINCAINMSYHTH